MFLLIISGKDLRLFIKSLYIKLIVSASTQNIFQGGMLADDYLENTSSTEMPLT